MEIEVVGQVRLSITLLEQPEVEYRDPAELYRKERHARAMMAATLQSIQARIQDYRSVPKGLRAFVDVELRTLKQVLAMDGLGDLFEEAGARSGAK
jgi:hypothetical protein